MSQAAEHNTAKIDACLYCVSQVTSNASLPLETKIRSILQMISQSLRVGADAAIGVRLDEHTFFPGASEYPISDPVLSEKIFVAGAARGGIDIFLPEGFESPETSHLTPEERRLIRTIARQLGLLIEKENSRAQMAALEAQVRHADRLAKIGRLAAGIAHEIGNPLNNILGFAQLALKSPDLSREVSADLDRIVKSALQAREIVKKLMFFSRRVPMRPQWMDLNAAVAEQLDLLVHLYEKQGIRVFREFSEAPCHISATPAHVGQVVMNLVLNAVQAMPRGGMMTVATTREKNGVSLIVKDTGSGMCADTLKRIFDPFFTTKDVDCGTGLGLSVVKGIMKAHGGDISVESVAGQGACFTATFPDPEEVPPS